MRELAFFRIMLSVTMLLFVANLVFAEDALFVDENGNVGVGTSDPQTPIEILSDSGKHLRLSGSGPNTIEFMDSDGMVGLGLHYRTTPDQLRVETNNGTTHFSINRDSGNVGIGTASPSFDLEVSGKMRQIMNSTYDLWIQGGSSTSGGDNRNLAIIGQDENSGDRLFINWNGEYANGTILGGKVGIGTSSPDAKLNVQGGSDVALSGGGFIVAGDLSGKNIGVDDNEIMARNAGSTSTLYIQNEGGSTRFMGSVGIYRTPDLSLDVYGTLRVNSSLYYSDERMKKNINNIDSSLKQLSRVRGVSYEWKDAKLGKKKHFGVLASEIEEIFPELVYTDKEGIKSVDYVGMIAPIIEAMKELKAENDELKDRLEEIEDMLDSK